MEDAQLFCGGCGAKVIRNRLSFGILWTDFRERFLNYDTSFLFTLRRMTTRPAEVINGYISGIRKKYMDPISYFGIALTLSGFQVFLTKKYFKDKISLEVWNSGAEGEVYSKAVDGALDYHAFFFVVLIPLFAFCGWVVFNRQQQYFSEHLVGATYILAHYSIMILPLTLLVLFANPAGYGVYSFFALAVMILYALFAYKQVSGYSAVAFLLRSGVFTLLFAVLYLLFSIGIMVFFVLIGVLSVSDFTP